MTARAIPEATNEQVQTAVTKTLVAQFTIRGEPVSKERARTTKTGHTYTPQKTVDGEAAVLAAYLQSEPLGMVPKGILCEMETTHYLGTKRARDGDNMYKLVADALNGQAYADDKQIIDGHFHVRFAGTRAEARTEVSLWMLTVGGAA